MTINDILFSDKHANETVVVYRSRTLIGAKDFNGEWFYRVQKRHGSPKPLVETENEDEAVRYLVGEK